VGINPIILQRSATSSINSIIYTLQQIVTNHDLIGKMFSKCSKLIGRKSARQHNLRIDLHRANHPSNVLWKASVIWRIRLIR